MLDSMNSVYESGSSVVVTPHYTTSMPGRVIEVRSRRVAAFVESVEDTVVFELIPAGELLISGLELAPLELVRYPGTGWVLVEFSTGISWLETLFHLKRILKRGYFPLVAHPERYRWCRGNPLRLVTLSAMGCGTLVSARSLRFEKYAATARRILAKGLAHGLCSDAHSPSDHILDRRLKARLEESTDIPWDLLTREIPRLVLDDKPLPPLPLVKREIN